MPSQLTPNSVSWKKTRLPCQSSVDLLPTWVIDGMGSATVVRDSSLR